MATRLATLDDAVGIAKVHVDTWRTSYQGIISDDVLAKLSYAQQEERWRALLSEPSQVTYVALDEAEVIVGFSNAGPERGEANAFDGELYAIYILEAFQGCGIGRELMTFSAEWLLSQGFSSLFVWVLADNPSVKFYEALGGQAVQEKTVTIGGKELAEIGYGWRDLAGLVDKLKR